MKKILFIISHLGSGSSEFCKMLNKNPRICFFPSNNSYKHPFDLETLLNQKHKLTNSAAIWADELLYNHSLLNKSLYPFCKFIYFIRNAKFTLSEIIKSKDEVPYKINYYTYRLRRIYEIASSAGGVVVDSDSVTQSLCPLEKYLNLKDSLENIYIPIKKHNPFLTIKDIEETERVYEKYYFLLKELKNGKNKHER